MAFFVLVLSIILSTALATVSSAADSVKLVSFDQFTNGNGNSSGQNNMSHGGAKQSKFERVKGADGGYYAVFSPTLTGTNPGHAFIQNLFSSSGVKLNAASGNKYLVYELDVTTETQYFPKLDFEFIGRKIDNSANQFSNAKPKIESDGNGGWKFSMSGKSVPMESERGAWQHITLIVEAVRTASGDISASSKVYVYYNGSFVASMSNAFKGDLLSLNSMRISMNTGGAVSVEDTLCIDNVRVSVVSEAASSGLASVLSNSSKKLTEWSESYYKTNYAFTQTRAIASAGDKYFSTVSQIEAEILANPGVEFTVLGNIRDTVDIGGDCFFYNPNGYEFNYNSGALTVYTTNATTAFTTDSGDVEVKWHVGEKVITESYKVGEVIIAPEFEPVYEKDGISYKAIGFAKTENGDITLDFGIASKYNNEFYAVFAESVASLTSSDGNKVFAYSESELDELFASSVSGDTITLLKSVTFGYADASAYTFTNKSVTFDLGGHTATIAKKRAGHIFTLGAGGNLTVKNGVLNGRDNGRIPEGEQAIVRRNIFKINNNATGAVLVAEDLVIEATKMMAAIGNGNATFRNCKISFKHDYENMIDLYSNGNESNPTKLLIENCDIEGYKTLINTYKPNGVNGIFAELTVKNSTLVTDERIVASAALSKATLDGGYFKGQYIFAGTSASANAKVHITNGTNFAIEDLDETNKLTFTMDGKLVKSGDKKYPFVVTKDYAKITWDLINERVIEYWANGALPECPVKIPTNTPSIRYTMDKPVAVSANKMYQLNVGLNFTPKISYTFGMDFSLNVYLPESDYKTLFIGESELTERTLPMVAIDGEAYYKISAPITDADGVLTLKMVFDTFAGERTYTLDVSLLKYIDSILSSECSFEEYNLALSALAYVKASTGEEASDMLYDMLDVYDVSKVRYPMADSEDGNLSKIIYDWNLDGTAIKIYFKSSFSGSVELAFGEEKITVEVSDGKVESSDFVEFVLPIYALASGVEVVSNEYRGRLSISSYADKVGKSDIYDALYSYSKSAEMYHNFKGGNS